MKDTVVFLLTLSALVLLFGCDSQVRSGKDAQEKAKSAVESIEKRQQLEIDQGEEVQDEDEES